MLGAGSMCLSGTLSTVSMSSLQPVWFSSGLFIFEIFISKLCQVEDGDGPCDPPPPQQSPGGLRVTKTPGGGRRAGL